MNIKSLPYLIGLFLLVPFQVFSDEEDRGGIEEITVTAEKRTSTVSDTSMSITAFDSSLLEDLGMQGADDLMDQLPATTRDAYDVRIRGVGRNFRALGEIQVLLLTIMEFIHQILVLQPLKIISMTLKELRF